MSASITYHPTPDEADRQAILDPLLASNRQNGPDPQLRPFAFLLKDGQGKTVGGLWGRTAYDWAVIELLFVPEPMRGSGTGRALVGMAEDLARRRGCAGIWLDSFDFQAPGFYLKLGYEIFGTLPDNPKGQRRCFLRKMLGRDPCADNPQAGPM